MSKIASKKFESKVIVSRITFRQTRSYRRVLHTAYTNKLSSLIALKKSVFLSFRTHTLHSTAFEQTLTKWKKNELSWVVRPMEIIEVIDGWREWSTRRETCNRIARIGEFKFRFGCDFDSNGAIDSQCPIWRNFVWCWHRMFLSKEQSVKAQVQIRFIKSLETVIQSDYYLIAVEMHAETQIDELQFWTFAQNSGKNVWSK